ncbi:hypothetical protein [Antricoccus suffuscus]|uniref:hypothetical protein n=1 Tax=Antricoccus suffuscus TaxID=1629062 RepID=UPI000D075858|nr:hypothetical protein [Antricoccus suffuscus]
MSTEIWISTAKNPDKRELEPEWHYAGRLEVSRETDLWKVVQGYLGFRAVSSLRSVDFYADLDVDSPGYQKLLEAEPGLGTTHLLTNSEYRFWLALKWSGPPSRIFFAAQRALLEPPQTRHRPEPHPGRLKRPLIVGMRLATNDGRLFDFS